MSGILYHYGAVIEVTTIIDQVSEGSPASRGGIKKGDRVLAVNGEKVGEWEDVLILVQQSGVKDLKFTLKRGIGTIDLVVVPEVKGKRLVVGIVPEVRQRNVNGVMPALKEGINQVRLQSRSQIKNIIRLVRGKISRKNLGGPVMILQETGKAAKMGLVQLVSFMIMLNIALGVFNFFPIPGLDGGYFPFLIFEQIFGRPLSKNTQITTRMTGIVMLLLLLVFATHNDLNRLFNK